MYVQVTYRVFVSADPNSTKTSVSFALKNSHLSSPFGLEFKLKHILQLV